MLGTNLNFKSYIGYFELFGERSVNGRTQFSAESVRQSLELALRERRRDALRLCG